MKLKVLTYLSTRLGERMEAVITGVADYGFFAQAVHIPAEGLVHVSSLVDDFYEYDDGGHTLSGKRSKSRFRLGDRVKVEVARVDLAKRMLDFRVARGGPGGPGGPGQPAPRPRPEPRDDAPRPPKPPTTRPGGKPAKAFVKGGRRRQNWGPPVK